MPVNLCIIGGNGFVGRAIVCAARKKGHRVTVACRHPERARKLGVEGASLAKVDITDGRGLDEAMAGADCVINLVGLLFEKGRYTFEAAHVRGTENVVDACQRAGVKQYLHMSALGADAASESAYARTKAEAEDYVSTSKNLNWTIFRPSIIFGAEDNFFNQFKAMSALLPVMPVIEGNTRFQPVWVEDVARAFIQAIDNRLAFGQTFELGGPKAYTFQELLELLMRVLDRRRLLLPVPKPMAKLIATFGQFLPTPPLTPDQLILLGRDNVTQGEAFPSLFGTPSNLEAILPGYIHGSRTARQQQSFDKYRRQYWKAKQ